MKPKSAPSKTWFRFAHIWPEGRSESEISSRLRGHRFQLGKQARIGRADGDIDSVFDRMLPDGLIKNQDRVRIQRRATCLANQPGRGVSPYYLLSEATQLDWVDPGHHQRWCDDWHDQQHFRCRIKEHARDEENQVCDQQKRDWIAGKLQDEAGERCCRKEATERAHTSPVQNWGPTLH